MVYKAWQCLDNFGKFGHSDSAIPGNQQENPLEKLSTASVELYGRGCAVHRVCVHLLLALESPYSAHTGVAHWTREAEAESSGAPAAALTPAGGTLC